MITGILNIIAIILVCFGTGWLLIAATKIGTKTTWYIMKKVVPVAIIAATGALFFMFFADIIFAPFM